MAARRGRRLRNERSYSQASATKYGLSPTPLPPPSCLTPAPITKLGSRPARRKTYESQAAVVLLPCVPLMAMPSPQWAMSSPSSSAYFTTHTPRRRASTISG